MLKSVRHLQLSETQLGCKRGARACSMGNVGRKGVLELLRSPAQGSALGQLRKRWGNHRKGAEKATRLKESCP